VGHSPFHSPPHNNAAPLSLKGGMLRNVIAFIILFLPLYRAFLQFPNINAPTGPTGTKGDSGADGRSAYEVAVENGFEGSKEEWLESLIGPAGPTGPTGATGPLPVMEFATFFHNISKKYVAGDLLTFDSTLSQNGISINSARTQITLGNYRYYRFSYGINVLNIDSGKPQLQLLINGNPLSMTFMQLYEPGNHMLDLISPVPPNAVISFRIINGDLTLAEDCSGITEYITITTIQQ